MKEMINAIDAQTVDYIYENNPITFSFGNEDVMINATQMAKTFGKQTYEYLRLPTTIELIKAITGKSRISENQLVTTRQGAPEYGGGTWMHEDIALDFAQWLSVDFKLWCNDRIKELLKHGITAIPTTIDNILADPANGIKLLQALQTERQEKERLLMENDLQTRQLKLAAPKVKYVDDVLNSSNTYTSTQMAKELGFTSAERLHMDLSDKKVMFKQSGQWMLTARYCQKGYTKTRTYSYTDNHEKQQTNAITVWTEKGREFLHNLQKVFSQPLN